MVLAFLLTVFFDRKRLRSTFNACSHRFILDLYAAIQFQPASSWLESFPTHQDVQSFEGGSLLKPFFVYISIYWSFIHRRTKCQLKHNFI